MVARSNTIHTKTSSHKNNRARESTFYEAHLYPPPALREHFFRRRLFFSRYVLVFFNFSLNSSLHESTPPPGKRGGGGEGWREAREPNESTTTTTTRQQQDDNNDAFAEEQISLQPHATTTISETTETETRSFCDGRDRYPKRRRKFDEIGKKVFFSRIFKMRISN